MVKREIIFFYDCLSPFSFFGFHVLKRYAPVYKVDLKLKPCLLGGLMAATNNSPPGMRPWAAAQAKWSGQDMQRNKAYFNTPEMKELPSNFFGPEGPSDKTGLARDFRYMRFLTAVSLYKPSALLKATEAIFEMMWTDERDAKNRVVITESTFERICLNCGLSKEEASKIVSSITKDEVKNALKQNVGEAVERGAFGVPFICVDDQIYFGSDRFEQLAFTNKFPWYGPDPSRPTVAKL